MNTKMDVPCFIDCEASSLSANSYPTEIAWARPDGSIVSHLINPYGIDGWDDWDPSSQAVTGISRELLRKQGKSPQDVVEIMNDELHDQTLYSDAPEFDDFWIRTLFEAVDDRPMFVIRNMWQVYRSHTQSEEQLQRYLVKAQEDIGQIHRATPDVQRMVRVWWQLTT